MTGTTTLTRRSCLRTYLQSRSPEGHYFLWIFISILQVFCSLNAEKCLPGASGDVCDLDFIPAGLRAQFEDVFRLGRNTWVDFDQKARGRFVKHTHRKVVKRVGSGARRLAALLVC